MVEDWSSWMIGICKLEHFIQNCCNAYSKLQLGFKLQGVVLENALSRMLMSAAGYAGSCQSTALFIRKMSDICWQSHANQIGYFELLPDSLPYLNLIKMLDKFRIILTSTDASADIADV